MTDEPMSTGPTSTGPMNNVLSARYASDAMNEIWSPERKVVLERELWIAVMRAQQTLGVDIPDAAIEAYVGVIEDVDLASIAEREAITRHDVKARSRRRPTMRRPGPGRCGSDPRTARTRC